MFGNCIENFNKKERKNLLIMIINDDNNDLVKKSILLEFASYFISYGYNSTGLEILKICESIVEEIFL